MRFRRNIERIGEIMAYELSKELHYKNVEIQTPLGIKKTTEIEDQLVLCSILRAGLPLHLGFLNYFDNANNFTHDLNPDITYNAKPNDPPVYKRKVIRGGSWKDISYYLQNGTRTYEYQDSTKSYIGFRNVLSFLGRSINDFK